MFDFEDQVLDLWPLQLLKLLATVLSATELELIARSQYQPIDGRKESTPEAIYLFFNRIPALRNIRVKKIEH